MRKKKRESINVKIKCVCGCGQTLYLCNDHDGLITLGTENSSRKSFTNFKGAVIDKKELLKALK